MHTPRSQHGPLTILPHRSRVGVLFVFFGGSDNFVNAVLVLLLPCCFFFPGALLFCLFLWLSFLFLFSFRGQRRNVVPAPLSDRSFSPSNLAYFFVTFISKHVISPPGSKTYQCGTPGGITYTSPAVTVRDTPPLIDDPQAHLALSSPGPPPRRPLPASPSPTAPPQSPPPPGAPPPCRRRPVRDHHRGILKAHPRRSRRRYSLRPHRQPAVRSAPSPRNTQTPPPEPLRKSSCPPPHLHYRPSYPPEQNKGNVSAHPRPLTPPNIRRCTHQHGPTCQGRISPR